jgi:hypothetical protein
MLGEEAGIHPVQPMQRQSAASPTSIESWRWIVELTTPAIALRPAAIHLWERKMLSLEYRWPGCRFLGWTTTSTPAMSTRRATETPNESTAADPAGDLSSRSQRQLVAESLLRCPRPESGITHGRAPFR